MMTKTQTEPYLSTYLHSKGGKLGLPIGGNFELTSRCNFRCPMCYVHNAENDCAAKQAELSADEWIHLARQARDRGMVFALLTGGEPFVRPDFFEIYHAIKEMGILVSINTNGSLLSGEIRARLFEDPPFRVNVSLYGGSEKTYESMCGRRCFATVVDNIRALRAHGIDVRLNLSITPYNCHDLEKIYAIANELEVHIKATAYMYPPIRINGEQYGVGSRLSPTDAARCTVKWDRMRFSREEFRARARNMAAFCATEPKDCSADLDEGVSCRAGSSAFWVCWDGKMLPCGMMPYPAAYPLTDGFDAAWDAIRTQTKDIRLPAECASCAKREVCPVCAAVCITETGAFDRVPTFVCQSTDALIKETVRVSETLGNNEGDGI